jgi:hypothetical protein
MNEELLKRLGDIRTALQAFTADLTAEYGDEAECVSYLKNADGELQEAERWEEEEEEEEEEEDDE